MINNMAAKNIVICTIFVTGKHGWNADSESLIEENMNLHFSFPINIESYFMVHGQDITDHRQPENVEVCDAFSAVDQHPYVLINKAYFLQQKKHFYDIAHIEIFQ